MFYATRKSTNTKFARAYFSSDRNRFDKTCSHLEIALPCRNQLHRLKGGLKFVRVINPSGKSHKCRAWWRA